MIDEVRIDEWYVDERERESMRARKKDKWEEKNSFGSFTLCLSFHMIKYPLNLYLYRREKRKLSHVTLKVIKCEVG